MVTKKQVKKNIVSSLVNAVLPDIMDGVGEEVAKLKYEKKEGDNRGFIRRGIGVAVQNAKEQFSMRNMATAFMSPTMKLLTHTMLDLRDEKKKDDEKEMQAATKPPKPKKNTNMGITQVTPNSNTSNLNIDDVSGDSGDWEIFEELIEKQEETIELLKHIDDNTKPNRLKERESEIEARNAKRQAAAAGLGGDAKTKKGGLGAVAAAAIGGTVKDWVMSAVAGWFGIKGAKAMLGSKIAGAWGATKAGIGSAAGAAGSALKKAPLSLLKGGKGLAGLLGVGGAAMAAQSAQAAPFAAAKGVAVPDVAKAATPAQSQAVTAVKEAATAEKVAAKAASSSVGIIQSIKEAGSNAAKTIAGYSSTLTNNVTTNMGGIINKGTIDSAKSIGTTILEKSKAVGAAGLGFLGKLSTPLTVGSTLLEANEVRTNESLSDSEKNVEYTKIGSRLAGMWAGAKAGAWAGAGIGGAAGTVVPGIGNAAGAAGGGIIGALGGAYAGYKLGDTVGDSAGKSIFGEKPKSGQTAQVEKIYPATSPEKIADVLATDYSKLPTKVGSYLTGKDTKLSYEDIQEEYKQYLKTSGMNDVSDNDALHGMSIAKYRAMSRAVEIIQLDKLNKEIETTKKSQVDISNLVNPQRESKSYDNLGAGETRSTALGNLSQEMDKTQAEKSKPQIITQPVIIDNTTNNNNSGNQQQNREGNLGVPDTRNTEGTIQRLLDMSYAPLLR